MSNKNKRMFKRMGMRDMSIRDCYEEIYHDEKKRGIDKLDLLDSAASIRANRLAVKNTWIYYNSIQFLKGRIV